MLVLPLYELQLIGWVFVVLVLLVLRSKQYSTDEEKGLWKRSDGRLDASCVHRHDLLSSYAIITGN